MGNKIFVCRSCKLGFNVVATVPKGQKCEKCQREPLTTLENWEEFICPKCKKKIDILTLQIMSDANTITEGLVKCKFDSTPLEWAPFEDKEGILAKEFEQDNSAWAAIILIDFEEQKKKEDELEAVILTDTFKAKADKRKETETKKPTFRLALSDTISSKVEVKQEKSVVPASKTKEPKGKQKKERAKPEKPLLIIQKPEMGKQKNKAEVKSDIKPPSAAMKIEVKAESKLESPLPKEVAPTPIQEPKPISSPSITISSAPIKPEAIPKSEVSESLWNDENVKLEEIAPILTSKPPFETPAVKSPFLDNTSPVLPIIPSKTDPFKVSEPAANAIPTPINVPPFTPSVPSVPSVHPVLTEAARVESPVQPQVSITEPIRASVESVKPDVIPKVEFPETLAIPETEIKIPSTDKFWDFYFNQKRFNDANNYLGGKDAEQEIIGLVGEINDIILNEDHHNPKKPVIYNQSEGLVYYVGDTHGSVIDTDTMIRYFIYKIEQTEKTKQSLKIIFIGDYVDRSPNDIHNFCYIFAFAIKYRKYIQLLRGNHEEVTINSNYGFRKNLQLQFNDDLFYMIEDTFAKLSLIHLLKTPQGAIIALHGGIPMKIEDEKYTTMPEIPQIEDPTFEIECQQTTIESMDSYAQQILWNDPATDLPTNMLVLPSRRGLGFNFGEEAFTQWMKVNHADRLIRAHEVFLEGHQEFFGNRLFSLFSASDYAGRKIAAKIMEVDLGKKWENNWRHLEILKDLMLDSEKKDTPKQEKKPEEKNN